ncbi:MAG: hypothetical protein EA424_12855, partial [Planctomycetaceae bacterium]
MGRQTVLDAAIADVGVERPSGHQQDTCRAGILDDSTDGRARTLLIRYPLDERLDAAIAADCVGAAWTSRRPSRRVFLTEQKDRHYPSGLKRKMPVLLLAGVGGGQTGTA